MSIRMIHNMTIIMEIDFGSYKNTASWNSIKKGQEWGLLKSNNPAFSISFFFFELFGHFPQKDKKIIVSNTSL